MTEAWLAELLQHKKLPRPRECVREIMLLMEGATVLMLIHGDRAYGTAVASAAKWLIGRGRG